MSGVFAASALTKNSYDYTQPGAYFITICTYQRQHMFGHVEEEGMVLSDAGRIAKSRWLALPEHHPHIELDAFIVMPNPVHGIVILHGEPSPPSTGNRLTSKSLGTIVGSYKSSVTRHIRQTLTGFENEIIWQARYHDHIIRNEADFNRIRTYYSTKKVFTDINGLIWCVPSLNRSTT